MDLPLLTMLILTEKYQHAVAFSCNSPMSKLSCECSPQVVRFIINDVLRNWNDERNPRLGLS